jgi:hypothetical protein
MNSAVLFIIFNRPEKTKQVFDAIASAKPLKMYIAADGSRKKINDPLLCKHARELVASIIWPCQVFTQFQEANLGCKY